MCPEGVLKAVFRAKNTPLELSQTAYLRWLREQDLNLCPSACKSRRIGAYMIVKNVCSTVILRLFNTIFVYYIVKVVVDFFILLKALGGKGLLINLL